MNEFKNQDPTPVFRSRFSDPGFSTPIFRPRFLRPRFLDPGFYEYDYKEGQSAGRAEKGHIGGMAQAMPESMSTGKQVDVGDVAMVVMGAIRNIDKRLQKMEKSRKG